MINTETFEYENSIAQDIYMHLKNNGFDVYFPAVKVGECATPYIVVKNDGSTKDINFSTDIDLYAIMVYVPKLKYSLLEPLVQEIKNKMRTLEPLVKPYGQQTSSFYDDSVKAHMISIEYKNYKKI